LHAGLPVIEGFYPKSSELDSQVEVLVLVMLRRVGVMSVAKICAIISLIVGLIEGIIFASLGGLLGGLLTGTPAEMLGAFGLTAIITFPISGAISGFIGGAIGAALYNLIAGKIGGIEMDLVGLQDAAATAPLPATPTPGKFCASCGAKIPSNAKFCGVCGANQG
jgi:hypothetical protein